MLSLAYKNIWKKTNKLNIVLLLHVCTCICSQHIISLLQILFPWSFTSLWYIDYISDDLLKSQVKLQSFYWVHTLQSNIILRNVLTNINKLTFVESHRNPLKLILHWENEKDIRYIQNNVYKEKKVFTTLEVCGNNKTQGAYRSVNSETHLRCLTDYWQCTHVSIPLISLRTLVSRWLVFERNYQICTSDCAVAAWVACSCLFIW